jgi:ATP-dependent protease ClpP protease subunit
MEVVTVWIEIEERPKFVPFYRRISAESVVDLMEQLGKADAPNGVYVSSPGGRFEFFAELAPAIDRRGIVTLSGNVRSAAVILALLGQTRYAFPDSTFFFHEIRTLIELNGGVTICDLQEAMEAQERMEAEQREFFEEWLRRMRMAQNWFIGFIAEKTGIRPAVFLDLMRQNATLDAREAVQYGIVHQIVPPEMRNLIR